MSIRSDICVLTLFELFKVLIHIAIKKKPISIDFFRKKKIARGTPRRKNRCHTCSQHNVSSSTYSVAGTPPQATNAVQQRLRRQGQWIRAQRADRNEKEFLDGFIQTPEQGCRPFRWSQDEA